MTQPEKGWFENLTTAVLAICAVMITVLVVRRELFTPAGAAGSVPKPRAIREWKDLARGGHSLGPPNAAVTILEFSDFQCPFCAAVQIPLKRLRTRYASELRVVYRHFPLESLHPYALAAAVAAECASEQSAFEQFHDVLFSAQAEIGVQDWVSFAVRAGIRDTLQFRQCLQSQRSVPHVMEDIRVAQSIQLGGTPAIILDGTLLPGTPTEDQLDTGIRKALGLRPPPSSEIGARQMPY